MKPKRYVGLRARYAPDEDCPLCDNPGSGMWLDLVTRQWICTRCKKEWTIEDLPTPRYLLEEVNGQPRLTLEE